MATIDLGTKHECAGCAARFYDMGKPAPVCPKCGIDQIEYAKSKAQAQAAAEAKVLADLEAQEDPVVEEIDDDEIIVDEEDEDEDEDDLPVGADEDEEHEDEEDDEDN